MDCLGVSKKDGREIYNPHLMIRSRHCYSMRIPNALVCLINKEIIICVIYK